MPAGAVYVGRPGPWGNPFHIERLDAAPNWWQVWPTLDKTDDPVNVFETKAEAATVAVTSYAAWISGDGPERFSIDAATYSRAWVNANARDQLGGRDLACWCSIGDPCHVDELLRIANPEG